MNKGFSTNVSVALTVALLISVVFLSIGWAKYLTLHVRVALAEEQTRYFDECVQHALQNGTPQDISEYIAAIKIYYPSGSKQPTGTHVDLMVERARIQAITQLEKARAVFLIHR
jgi:hypothetical protein